MNKPDVPATQKRTQFLARYCKFAKTQSRGPASKRKFLSNTLSSSASLCIAATFALVQAAQAADANADKGDWPVYGHSYDNQRFSPLTQINVGNVAGLKLAYAFSLASLRSN